ncbi:hypothetical protein K490DRAFT_69843 [Saccharata proteae CBS 121410]|uniref:Fumarylacetoacetate hydrolase-like protein n=1 Tax=Saccharata proteae CBS 121410 TaxID=1314787 RepID=A0A9P4LVV7_9PEZI|nr:hypothetical protein K490DRAFT_69843 [Saccharata proteae CBS 121410]
MGQSQFEPSVYNYVAYLEKDSSRPHIGQLQQLNQTVQPLAFASGTPLENLYQVIEAGEKNVKPYATSKRLSAVKLLPPISGRDVLAVGKNYAEHAKEFNSSGYDSSDKVDQPTHPVIFTKRATSIIAHGEEIYPHVGFTESADYEGEIGVVIGKSGFRISEENAMDHVWGYTIINDVTARERQRDHKQFYIGKSADTYCPMGPIAVPASKLPAVLELETRVNGELKQKATSADLIFSIPHLIKTLSEGQTLQLGDVIATGTPAGVGIGKKPPVFLKPGDEISISVTGLGTLSNRVGTPDPKSPSTHQVRDISHIPVSHNAQNTIVFIHGLGGSLEYFQPLAHRLSVSFHGCYLFDLEGHGLTPTSALNTLRITSFANDLASMIAHAHTMSHKLPTTIVAQGLGCLVALKFAHLYPSRVRYLKLILLSPAPIPMPKEISRMLIDRAAEVRSRGALDHAADATVDELATPAKKRNPLLEAAVRMSVLGQDPEGYAKGCEALAFAENCFADVRPEELMGGATLIVAGDRDWICTPEVCEHWRARGRGKVEDVVMLKDVGGWPVFEDLNGVAEAVEGFIKGYYLGREKSKNLD